MELYFYLKAIPLLKNLETKELFDIANSIIERKLPEINAYLDSKSVSITQSEKASTDIFSLYLIPEINKLKL